MIPVVIQKRRLYLDLLVPLWQDPFIQDFSHTCQKHFRSKPNIFQQNANVSQLYCNLHFYPTRAIEKKSMSRNPRCKKCFGLVLFSEFGKLKRTGRSGALICIILQAPRKIWSCILLLRRSIQRYSKYLFIPVFHFIHAFVAHFEKYL
jgi:hypothetical protein